MTATLCYFLFLSLIFLFDLVFYFFFFYCLVVSLFAAHCQRLAVVYFWSLRWFNEAYT